MAKCYVVCCAKRLKVFKYRKLRHNIRIYPSPKMLKIILEQVIIGALGEALGCSVGALANALYFHLPAAHPGEPEGIIKRVQHGKAHMCPQKRHSCRCKAVAKAANDFFQTVP